MSRHTLALLGAAVLAAPLAAADPEGKPPPVDTSFLKRYAETRGFMLGRPSKPKFTPDGKHVLFLRAAGPTTPRLSLFEFDVATGQTRELLSAESLLKGAEEALTPEEKARRERQRVSVGGFADYHLSPDGGRVLVMLSGKLYVFDRGTGKAAELATGPGTLVDPKWSPDGKRVGYVKDHDVWVYDLAAGKEHAVTAGGTAEKTHGLAEFVAQEEMDRHTGYWWSPDSKMIAYTEADHAGVEVWHIADPLRPDRGPQPQYYPRPGRKNVSVRLGVVPVDGGKTAWVEWDQKKYEYLAAVKWGHAFATRSLWLLVQDRRQQVQTLLEATHGSERVTPVLTESDPTWVAIPANVPAPTHRSGSFIWVGDHSDRRRLQLWKGVSREATVYDLPAGVEIGELIGTNVVPTFTTAYFSGTADPTQQHVWRVPIVLLGNYYPGSGPKRLTDEPGVHTGVPESRSDTNRIAITSTTLTLMPQVSVYGAYDEKTLGTLPSVAADPPFVPNVTVQKVGDGDDSYYTAVVRPRDFDPKKKYPVIVDVYGGPHHIHVQQAMRNWLVPQWLADQGFVVVAIDNRGTPGRGAKWEKAIYQKLGTVPLDDQVKGLKLLGERFPELDLSRVGIVGWSFGGYMAANAVLRRPDVFHAAVAGAPVTDWEDYDTHYTERYLGLLPESKKAYEEASLIPLAKNLSRPLLLVHGTADDNVYYRHTLKLADALFRAGREFETLPLPGVTHMYTADPQVTERLWERNVRFFKRHLGGPR